MKRKNNEQIDETDYYRLPCGRFLEDFIWAHGLYFAEASALKYKFRAGKKDGEPATKDADKMMHYITFIAGRTGSSKLLVLNYIEKLYNESLAWSGEDIDLCEK